MKKSSPIEEMLAQATEAESKLRSATAKLSHIEKELSVAQRKQTQNRERLRAETEKLLTGRAVALETLEGEYRGRVETLSADLERLRSELAPLQAERDLLLEEIPELEQKKTTLYRDISGLEGAIKTERDMLAEVVLEGEAVNHTLGDLRAQIPELQAHLDGLIQELAALEGRRGPLERDLALLERESAERVDKLKEEVSILEKKKTSLILSLNETQKEQELVRRELADRQLKLDEREVVLRRREFKVNQDESTIQQNARLLDL